MANDASNLVRDLKRLGDELKSLDGRAAKSATQVARKVYRTGLSGRPPMAGPRNRKSTFGNLPNEIQYHPEEKGGIRLDTARLDAATKIKGKLGGYWRIQNIGSGESANEIEVTRSGEEKPTPVSVLRQKGREIHPALQWTGSDNKRVPPARGVRTHQINYVGGSSSIDPDTGKEVWTGGNARPFKEITIRKEIIGKGFVKAGTDAGLEFYQNEIRKILDNFVSE